MNNELLEQELPTDGEHQTDTPEWRQVLKMIERGDRDRRDQLDTISKIIEEYEEQFDVEEQTGTSFLRGTTLFSAHTRSVSKMRMLKQRTYLHGAPEVYEKIVSQALDLGVKETGLLHACTGRFGAFHRQILTGDAFIMAREADDDESFPIRFDTIDLESLYIDPFAVDMQNDSSYQDADEVMIVFEYSYDEFLKLYPEQKGKVFAGELPMSESRYNEFDSSKYTDEQETDKEERKIQVGYYMNKSLDRMVIFAGAGATQIEDGELEFSDILNRKILPVFQLVCFPTPRGLFNAGYGHLITRPHRVKKQLVNAAISAVINRIDPIYYTELSAEETEELTQKIEEAMDRGKLGGVKIMVFDKKAGEQKPMKIESLIGEQLTGDFERIYNAIDREILQMGVNLDDIPQQSVDTATQATLREQAANSNITQIQEGNGNTFQRMYELILTSIRDKVKDDNEYPLRMKEQLTAKDIQQINEDFGDILGEEVTEISPTLGFAKRILKKYPRFSIDIDLRSGAYPDMVSEWARTKELTAEIGNLAPGTPAHMNMIRQMSKISGEPISEEELHPPQVQPQEMQPQ